MVKRYSLMTHEDCLEASMFGSFVAHDDYAVLEAENASLRARIEAAPHSLGCACVLSYDGYEFTPTDISAEIVCDCWKSAP